jgi:hypothetical protein
MTYDNVYSRKLRLSPSDPLFADWDALLTLRAALMNPACHADLAAAPAAERQAAAVIVDDLMHQAWDELTR